jgi:hypothetical protein
LLPFEDPQANVLLAPVPETERGERFWLALGDGTLVAGDRGGAVSLLMQFTLTRPIGRVVQRLRLASTVDALYKRVARSRSQLGGWVPDGPAPRRFP